MFENQQVTVIEAKCLGYWNSSECLRLTVARIIDQFGRKRCQTKRKDVEFIDAVTKYPQTLRYKLQLHQMAPFGFLYLCFMALILLEL